MQPTPAVFLGVAGFLVFGTTLAAEQPSDAVDTAVYTVYPLLYSIAMVTLYSYPDSQRVDIHGRSLRPKLLVD